MKRKLIFLIVIFSANIDFVFADWPHVVRCPMIYSVAEPIGSSTMRNGFPHYSRSDYGLFVATGKSEKQYPAKKFIGADVKNYNTFSCNYEATDGTHVTTKFTISKCQPMAGFDISVKCNNPDPGQCLVMCAY